MLRKYVLLVAGIAGVLTCALAQPTIQISNATADNGQTVNIALTVDDYTDLISLQFNLNWDPSVLQYQGVSNLTGGLPGFTESSSINLFQAGILSIVWFESNITPTTLPDGTTLFEVSFLVVGDPCDSTGLTLSDIEIADASEQDVGANVLPGYVNVPGSGCGTFDGVRIIGEMKTIPTGGSTCIRFTTQGFNNVIAASYTITFDPAVIQYTGIQNINWPDFAEGTTFSAAEAASGILRVVWTDGNAQGIDIADGTVLYELCFQAVGSGGQMSQIGFGNSPVQIEFADGNSDPLQFQGTPGKITLEGQLEGFALIMPDVTVGLGEEVCLPVTVNDFNDIIAVGGSINWDSTVLEFVRFEGFNLPGLEDFVTGPEVPGNNAGQASIAWTESTLQGITLPNGTEIMRICFNVIGACNESSPVQFTSEPTLLEFADVNDEITDYTILDGSVTIDCNQSGCGATTAVHHLCPGDECGSIDITLIGENCSATPTYMWWPGGQTTQDLPCVGPGKYVVTITNGSQFIIPDTIIVRQLNPIQVSANITDSPNGNDGAISIMVTGGLPGYQYIWSNPQMSTTSTISNLAPGSYSVTITDMNGCLFVGGPFVVQGDGISANVTNVCGGGVTGSIEITNVSCVTGTLTYQWSVAGQTMPVLSNLNAGTYSVTVTGDGGATCSASFQILAAASPIEVAIDTVNETMTGNNGEIHLTVTGGQSPYSYAWDGLPGNTPDQTGLTAGAYTVTITDQLGCENVQTIILRGNALFVDVVGSSFNGSGVSCAGTCDGEILAVPGNVIPPVSYAWSNGGTGQLIDDVCPGTYTVTVTDQLGSTATASYTVTEPPGILLQLQITCASEPGSFDGKAVTAVSGGTPPYFYKWSDGTASSSLQNISTGAYSVTVTDNNGCEVIRRFDICIEGVECYEAISVITPNDDGKNDLFIINCVYDLPSKLLVYNRYGGLVFEMNDYDNSWDGVDLDGNPLSDGGYHWVLLVDLPGGEKRVHKGTVSIVRSFD